ncbi:MAG TPA: DUF3891 family protein [Thermoanaerobaculia bacterium]|jgi:hypothetical protein|nr:DUF3891 family protein [Thermoanaerobaculia bacterium]
MIVQQPIDGDSPFVIPLDSHQALAGQLAGAFGNDAFEALEPQGIMLFAVRHHDAGWAAADDEPDVDAATGLPFSLEETPWPALLAIGPASADFNEKWHPYAGLLASMHVHGLYHDRYGLTRTSAMHNVPPAYRDDVARMLDAESDRRRRILDALREEETGARWVSDDVLSCNYFRLQFFDRLAVNLNRVAPALIRDAEFHRVPAAPGREMTISLTVVAPGVLRLRPFPFAGSPLEVTCRGRYVPVRPGRTRKEMIAALREAPETLQRFTLLEDA